MFHQSGSDGPARPRCRTHPLAAGRSAKREKKAPGWCYSRGPQGASAPGELGAPFLMPPAADELPGSSDPVHRTQSCGSVDSGIPGALPSGHHQVPLFHQQCFAGVDGLIALLKQRHIFHQSFDLHPEAAYTSSVPPSRRTLRRSLGCRFCSGAPEGSIQSAHNSAGYPEMS